MADIEPLTVKPVIVLIEADKSTPSFLDIVNVFASLYVNPVTKVFVNPVKNPQISNVVPLFVTNVTHPLDGL